MDYNKIYYNENRDEILEKRRARYWRNIEQERERSKNYQKKLRESKKQNDIHNNALIYQVLDEAYNNAVKSEESNA